MSGPKKSRWQIQEERRRERERREREKYKKLINQKLNLIYNKMEEIRKKDINSNSIKEAEKWLQEIKQYNNLKLQLKELSNLEKYLDTAKKIIEFNSNKSSNSVVNNPLIESLDNLKDLYKEIMNEGIIQRIELFKESLKVNPNNKAVLDQISQFKSQLNKIYQDYEKQNRDIEYVAEVFSDILSSNKIENENEIFIKGKVGDVDISVRLNKKSNDIDFDTPYDNSCKDVMNRISSELSKNGVDLGEIKVLKTGQILNYKNISKNKQKVRS